MFPGVKEFGLFDVFKRVWETGNPEYHPISLYKDERIIGWRENYVYKLPSGEIVAVYDDVTEYKQAEETLRESEEKHRLFFENSPIGIIHYDNQGIITDVNEAMITAFGSSREKLIGLDINDIPDKKFSKEVYKSLNGEPGYYEGEYKSYTGGKAAIIKANWIPIIRDGEAVAGVGIVEDVTEKKQAEELLQKSEKKYRTLLETTSEGFWLLNPERKTIEVNEALCKMLGYSQDEMLGKTPLDFVDDENRKIFIKQTSKISTSSHRSYEIALKKKNGENLHTYFNATTIRDESGEIQGSFALTTDITERKWAEEALRESEEKYRSIMEAMNDAAYICSSDFRIEYMNPAMTKKLDRDATGESCHKTIHGLDEKCPCCSHGEVMQGEYVKNEIVSPKDGKNYHISNSPIFHTDGSISKLSIFRNITEVKKMQEQLQQAQKMESIGTLAGGIAHDFNNILMSIIGYGEIMDLFDIAEDNPIRSSLDQILKAAYRAKDLVQHILTFSRQTEQETKPLLLSAIVKEALKFLKASLPSTIEIHQNIEKETGPILADATQVHQVVMNLCTNAAQAMGENQGVLEVTLDELSLNQDDTSQFPDLKPGTYLKLTVSDTGNGMDTEVMARIFDPFFTTKKHGEGTGIGLSVVHGIVNSHDGAITVESEPGAGSTFRVFLPLLKQDPVKTQTEIILPPLTKGNESILLVDDEKSIVNLGVQALGNLGYKITGKTSSKEALKFFQSQPGRFNLVITDLTMPDMTGVELTKKLLQIRPDIPIILCTGYSDKITPEKAEAMGIREFIIKPFGPRDLAESVRRVLDST